MILRNVKFYVILCYKIFRTGANFAHWCKKLFYDPSIAHQITPKFGAESKNQIYIFLSQKKLFFVVYLRFGSLIKVAMTFAGKF